VLLVLPKLILLSRQWLPVRLLLKLLCNLLLLLKLMMTSASAETTLYPRLSTTLPSTSAKGSLRRPLPLGEWA
jgi:hypothetical protein